MKVNAYVFATAVTLVAVLQQAAVAQYPYYDVMPQPGFLPASSGITGSLSTELLSQGAHVAGADNCNACEDCQGGCGDCCCGWTHRWGAFGEFLYLRARDAEVAFAAPIDGPIVAPPTQFPVQIAPIGVVDQDYDMGFRGGLSYILDEVSSITAQYSMFETQQDAESTTEAPNVVRSLVAHPGTLTAAQDWLAAAASHSIAFDLVDIDYRGLFAYDCDMQANFLVGVRYANLEQQFLANYSNNGSEDVATDIDFDGVGLRLGIEGERTARCRWLVYGKAHGSLMAGEFRASYLQVQSFDPVVVDTHWEAGRLVPILDLEVGGGWTSKCGTWRLSAGYVFSAWFNTVKTDEWINAVRNNNYLGLGDTMTFDGLVARVEGRF